MPEKENGELVRSFYANMLAGDIDAVVALLAPDFELVYSGPSIIPASGVWHGHDGFRNWAQAALGGHLPPESVSFEDYIIQANEVVVPGHVALRIKTTGKTCETDFLHLWTVGGGKLIRWRDFFDTFAVAQAYIP